MNAKEVFTLIKTRRSIRQFAEGILNQENLKMILEAGLYAPSAMCGQNMLLMAHALGLGVCLIGRASEVFDSDIGRAIWQQNSLSDDAQAYYHIIIGQPKEATYCKKRNPNRIIIIE